MLKRLSSKYGSLSQRTKNVTRNTIAVAIMKIATLLCSLMLVPITIDYLDNENYGIWMAMTSILYWFVFMDVGLGNGMRNYLAEAISRNDYVKARSYFSTAMLILTAIAACLGIVAIPIVYCVDLNSVFNTSHIDGNHLALILSIAIVITLIQFVVKNIGMVFVAMQKYAVNDFIIFLGSILSVSVIYLLTKTTQSNLLYVVVAATGAPALMFSLALIPLLRKYPQLTPNLQSIDMSIAKQIVTKGLGFFAIQITSCLVIFGSANVFISHYCGPQQVTVYNVAYKLFNLLVIAYTIVLAPLWNAYTDAAVKNDYEWIRKTFNRSFIIWVLSVFAGLVLLLISNLFFKIWVGDNVTVPFCVSACVFAYVSAFNLNNCMTYLINGLNKIRVQIITSVVITVMYVLAVWGMKGTCGVVGIVLAMVGAYVVMALIHYYQCRLLIQCKAKGIWNK